MNISLSMRPATKQEYDYTYSSLDPGRYEQSGCIGHLRAYLDADGSSFPSTWDDHCKELKTTPFKVEINEVIDRLRFGPVDGNGKRHPDELTFLANRTTLRLFCGSNPAARMNTSEENYAFRADTEAYSYLLRVNPNRGVYNLYAYCYDKARLDRHLNPEQEKDTLTVVLVEPGKLAKTAKIGKSLEAMQKVVGGNIEPCYPFTDDVCIVCNEEGKINGLPLNRALYDNDGNMLDIVCGSFFVCGCGEEDFSSLTPEQLTHYTERFKRPEHFLRIGEAIRAVPYEPGKTRSGGRESR